MINKGRVGILVLALLIFCSGTLLFAAPQMPAAEGPVLLSSAGQSPGGTMMKLMLTRNSIDFDYLQIATVDQIKSKGYKTIVLALGTSLKGMGAAGIDFDTEIERIQGLIDYAESNDILVLGFHIEGEARRGGYDEEIITKFVPQLDGLVYRIDGNQDGIFTSIASKNNIPVTEIEKTIDLGPVLKKIFK